MKAWLRKTFPTLANAEAGELIMMPYALGLIIFFVAWIARPIMTHYGVFMHPEEEEMEECPWEGACDYMPKNLPATPPR